jgi:hypothetical protein
MSSDLHNSTRRALHAVAEMLLAGPQHAETDHIRLRAIPGGFATALTPEVSVIGAEIVHGHVRVALDGRTIRDLAAELALPVVSLAAVYSDVSDISPDEPLSVDVPSAERIAEAYSLGDAALRTFAPGEEPVLWPEHFDIAIAVDGVNYGVTPGDTGIETPYMYVGPWPVPTGDDFWNASFGAAQPLPSTVGEIVAFFIEGQRRITG